MIDKIDIQILEILQRDGRTSASDIAKAVELSVPAIGERIKKLSEKKFIKKHTTILGHKEAGLDLTAYVFIVSEHSDHYDKFVKEFKSTNNVDDTKVEDADFEVVEDEK